MESKTITTSGLKGPDVYQADTNKASHTVMFKVKYTKDYEGPRDMPDGSEQVVAPDTAEHFINLGIGHIIETDEQVEKVLTEPAPPFKDSREKDSILTAAELIEAINKAETAEAVDALVAGDEGRKTVLAAVEVRKKALNQ